MSLLLSSNTDFYNETVTVKCNFRAVSKSSRNSVVNKQQCKENRWWWW